MSKGQNSRTPENDSQSAAQSKKERKKSKKQKHSEQEQKQSLLKKCHKYKLKNQQLKSNNEQLQFYKIIAIFLAVALLFSITYSVFISSSYKNSIEKKLQLNALSTNHSIEKISQLQNKLAKSQQEVRATKQALKLLEKDYHECEIYIEQIKRQQQQKFTKNQLEQKDKNSKLKLQLLKTENQLALSIVKYQKDRNQLDMEIRQCGKKLQLCQKKYCILF